MNLELLRNKILQLAFSGKIVENNFYEDAENTYKKICKEKDQLVIITNSRRDIKYSKPDDEEILFSIPKNWKWIRLGEIGVFKKGPFGSSITKDMFVKKDNDSIKVYEQQNAIKKSDSLGTYYIKKDYFEQKMKGFEVFSGDIIVSCAGTIGECYVMPSGIERGIINQALMKMSIVSQVDKQYFLLYFNYILKDISNKQGKGTGMKNIPPFDIFKQLLIPLPCFEEQQRIANKVSELFNVINDIENSYNKLKKLKTLLVKKIIVMAVNGELFKMNKSLWKSAYLGNVLKYEQPTKYKVSSEKYDASYKIPVLTAGKTFILGYTNDKEGIFDKFPVIIFDDFTTDSKYVDFSFKVKSDAMKILSCSKEMNIKYYYYIMQSINYNASTHKRYWISEYSKIVVPVPSREEQDIIVEKIDKLLLLINEI